MKQKNLKHLKQKKKVNLTNNENLSFSTSSPERTFKSSLLLDSLATIKDVLENRTTYPPVENIEIRDKEGKDIIFTDKEFKNVTTKDRSSLQYH